MDVMDRTLRLRWPAGWRACYCLVAGGIGPNSKSSSQLQFRFQSVSHYGIAAGGPRWSLTLSPVQEAGGWGQSRRRAQSRQGIPFTAVASRWDGE